MRVWESLKATPQSRQTLSFSRVGGFDSSFGDLAMNIYLIWQDGTSLYKMGKANNPSKRLKELQTGHSGKLHLIAEMPCSEALRKESYLHAKYKQYRVHGEWFNIPPTLLHEVFAEFQFHVKATPDTPVYYWASVAETWKTAAITIKEKLKEFDEVGVRAIDYISVCSANIELTQAFLLKMCNHLPVPVIAEPFKKYSDELKEIDLIAAQIGITEA